MEQEIREAQARFAVKKSKLEESLTKQLNSLQRPASPPLVKSGPLPKFEAVTECQLCYSDTESRSESLPWSFFFSFFDLV